MKCVICKESGVWSQRFGMILCNACKREAERGTVVTLANDKIIILGVARNEKAEAIEWLRQYKEKARVGRA